MAREDQTHDPRPTADSSAPSFAVVGVGASAGGLAAIEEFLSGITEEAGPSVAVVVVQHLDPEHDSLLLELISRSTHLGTQWAADGMRVEPDNLYVMPRGHAMEVDGDTLRVSPTPETHGLRLPIDDFLASLAASYGQRAVGVILSGTGSDGARGLAAIADNAGLTLVQDPESAAYDGMPLSAIEAVGTARIAPPHDMAGIIAGYIANDFSEPVEPAVNPDEVHGDKMREVLSALRNRTGHDFTQYKMSTIRRRVARRMAIAQTSSIDEYLRMITERPAELDTLFHELLIGVTEFFRDPAAFDAIAEHVLPNLADRTPPNGTVRIWVPACSTGEEAYSIAILVHEALAVSRADITIQIFATDIDIRAVEHARAGVYPATIAANVSASRLEANFTEDRGGYRISKDIRDLLVFAKQDLIKDPPFSKVDLISCRNLLIYLDADLQKRLMPVFHYALNPGGFLMLGSSETIGDAGDLFEAVDTTWKLFARREPGVLGAARSAERRVAFGSTVVPETSVETKGRVRVSEVAEAALLERHVPASVVVNRNNEVLYIHGHTGRYLEPAPGEASGNILKMARDGLRRELSSGLRRARTEHTAITYGHVAIDADEGTTYASITIEPLVTEDDPSGLLLVLFSPVSDAVAGQHEQSHAPTSDREQRIADLDRELTAKEEFLRTTVDDLESTNDELRSANEELQSTNEELQSTNEELETSKEELQSVNEELVTVNSELQQKISALSQANNDMNNLLAGTGIGTVFLDNDLLIQRFTPAATQIIKLIPTDVGRPVGDIASRLRGSHDLTAAARDVLDTLKGVESEVVTDSDRTYLMRIQPYRTAENVIEGAVMTFIDVTTASELRQQLDETARKAQRAREFAEAIVDTISDPLLVLDRELTVVSVGRAFAQTFGLAPGALEGTALTSIDGGAWNCAELLDALHAAQPEHSEPQTVHLTEVHLSSGTFAMTVNARELAWPDSDDRMILLAITNLERAPAPA